VKKIGLLVVVLLTAHTALFAQTGNFYLSHFQHNIDNIDNQNRAILQDNLGVIYAANRKGILRFDGANWDIIFSLASVYSLDLEKNTNTVYVGAKNDFGYVSRLSTGREIYQSIKDTTYTNVDFNKTIVWENSVYFYGNSTLIKYEINSKKIVSKWKTIDKKPITSLFIAENKLYVEVADRGIYLFDGSQFKQLYVQLPNKDKIISARELPHEQGVILITLAGKLYRFYGNTLLPFGVDELEYLEKSQVADALVLDSSLVLFSTMRGGCVVVNYQEGKVVQFVNYQSGLPDEDILAIAKDKSKGVWIAHRYGLSRLDYGLPIRDFSQFGGLEGHILAVQPFQDILYVATSTGVFYLDEIKKYDETTEKVSVLVKTNKSKNPSHINLEGTSISSTSTNNPVNSESTTASETIDISLPTVSIEEAEVVNPNVKVSEKPKLSYRRRVIEKKFIDIKSIRYLFKRVEGIEGKCDRFLIVGNTLLASGSAGLFLIGDKKEEAEAQPKAKKRKVVRKVESKVATKTKNKKAITLSSEPMLYAVKAAKKNIIYATTDEGRLVMLNMIDKKIRNLVKFNDEIDRITEDSKGNLWVCGSDFIYKVELKKKKPKVTSFPVENEYNDQIIPLKAYSRIYFILSSEAYYFNEQKGEMVKDSIMIRQINQKAEFISYNEKILWTKYKNQWNVFGDIQFPKENLTLFKLLENIENIIPDKDGTHFWLITRNNGLFKFDATIDFQFSQDYGLLLNFIKNKQGSLISLQNSFQVDYNNNALTFSLTTPEYLKGGMVEYQYILEGNMKKWSDWTSNGNFTFPVLGSGKYILKVRSRNVFGNIVETNPFIFTVEPPYWQTFWFNAIEVSILLILLIAASLINRYFKHENRLWTIGKRVVTMLTLVVCIEFLQTILQGYIDINGSPVKDFVVEVALALTLLPLEWVLMKMITAQFKKKKIKTVAKSDIAESGNIQAI